MLGWLAGFLGGCHEGANAGVVAHTMPPPRFDPSAFVGRTVKQMDEALKGHRGEATAEVTAGGESMPSAELGRLAEIVPAACVLYASSTTSSSTLGGQDTAELQWQIASYADVELLMGEAPTLIGCVHADPWAIANLNP